VQICQPKADRQSAPISCGFAIRLMPIWQMSTNPFCPKSRGNSLIMKSQTRQTSFYKQGSTGLLISDRSQLI